MANEIFVFGSNLAGIHGAGAARVASRLHGAVWNLGQGRAGNSYAIPTKDMHIQSLTLAQVLYYVEGFLEYARKHPELNFKVTRIGCGLAGFKDSEIAPMFEQAGANCSFDLAWKPWLPNKYFWGTY